MADDRLRGDEDAQSGGVRAPAQVDVVAHQGQPAVESAEPLEDVAPDQHAGGGHRQHGPDVVVLALVLLAAVQAGPAAAGVGDGDADLQQLPAVVPAAQFGADDGDVVAAEFILVSTTRSSWARASGSGAQSSCSSHSQWTGSPWGSSGMS